MLCHCGDMNMLFCKCCQQTFAVKLTGLSHSSTVRHGSLCDTKIDTWSFGRLVLEIFVCEQPLKVRLILCVLLVCLIATFVVLQLQYTLDEN